MAAMVDRILALAPSQQLSPVLSPAGSSSSSASSTSSSENVRCKRKINFQQQMLGMPPGQPVSVARRNARERNRVKQVNNGFSTLRQHIPFTARNKKMSKVETLRCAVEYIRSLKEMLEMKKEDVPMGAESPAPSSVEYNAFSPASEATTASVPTPAPAALYQPAPFQPAPAQPFLLQPASLSPPCSAASEPASSPTPSFTESEHGSYHHHHHQTHHQPAQMYTTLIPADPYEHYQPMSPEDEVLLDAISWWQQSQ